MADSTRGNAQKPQGKPHTGMIEFKYSKIFEDYEKMKSAMFDMEAFKRMHPKKEGIQVVLHNIEDKSGRSADLKILSYILRSGNFGNPAPVNLTSLPLGTDNSSSSSLPSVSTQRATTSMSMASAALSKASKSVKTSGDQNTEVRSYSKLPSIKSNTKRNTFMTEANRKGKGGNK